MNIKSVINHKIKFYSNCEIKHCLECRAKVDVLKELLIYLEV